MNQVPNLFIVDDEEKMCRSLESVLREAGYRVSYTTSGISALENVEKDPIDLFLLDIHIPDLDGFSLLERIMSRRSDAPVIMMTGDTTVDSAVKALRKGAYDYLKKPFEPEELVKTIDNALRQKALLEKTHLLDNRLRLSERRFRFMLQNSPDMVYTLDPEGRFKFINDAAEPLFGYRPTDLVGQHYETVLWGEDIPSARWHFNERRTGTRATSGLELRLRPGPYKKTNGGNGELVFVNLNATGVYRRNPGGRRHLHVGTYGIIRDVTPYRLLKKQRHQARSVEAVAKLAGGTAHELNNLLMATRVMTSVLTYKMQPDHPYLNQVDTIDRYVENCEELTRRLLYFTKGEKMEIQSIDVSALSRRVTFRLKAANAEAVALVGDFNRWCDDGTPLSSEGDGWWWTTMMLPPGRYEFKFKVDGQWREGLEKEPTVINRYGTLNNYLVVNDN